jgi:hypothetical protein
MYDSLSYFIIGGGCLAILAGLAFLAETARFLRAASRAAAAVVGYETRVGRVSREDGGKVETHFLHPVVEFEDGAGRRHRVTMDTGSTGEPPFPVGSRVEILFRPGDPSAARIRCFSHLWLFPAVFMAVGLFGVTFGLAIRAVAGAAP